MFLGFDDRLKSLKKEWKDAGVNLSLVREWQKSYDKVVKTAPELEQSYAKASQDLQTVYVLLQNMEQQLVDANADPDAIGLMAGELKKYQNGFNHEFLIGKEDRDFHLTYSSILSLADKYTKKQANLLILQSEVENLLAVVKEALEKQLPSGRALAFFYTRKTDSDLSDLPHTDKLRTVNVLYEQEFLDGLRNCLSGYISEKRIRNILEVELWK